MHSPLQVAGGSICGSRTGLLFVSFRQITSRPSCQTMETIDKTIFEFRGALSFDSGKTDDELTAQHAEMENTRAPGGRIQFCKEEPMKTHPKRMPFNVICSLGFFAASLIVETATAQNLVVNGAFENGNSGFTTGYAFGDVSGPGTYNIGTSPSSAPGAFGDWCNCGDHTTGTGMMMIVNGANSASSPVWEEVVQVVPSTEYTFSYWGAEVDHDSSSLPHLALKINGRVIGSSFFPQHSPDNNGQWQNFSFTWNSSASHTADLALFDLNVDSGWNDFALDDISFSPIAASASASSAGHSASTSGPIRTHAQITVKDANEVTIPFRPEEQVAFMFVYAIASMEDDCNRVLGRRCSLDELVAGVNSPSWKIGRLRYDPAVDPNYKYTVTITGAGFGWTTEAIPQRSGLGGFFVDGTKSMIPDYYYDPNGHATAKARKLPDISIGGELFQVR